MLSMSHLPCLSHCLLQCVAVGHVPGKERQRVTLLCKALRKSRKHFAEMTHVWAIPADKSYFRSRTTKGWVFVEGHMHAKTVILFVRAVLTGAPVEEKDGADGDGAEPEEAGADGDGAAAEEAGGADGDGAAAEQADGDEETAGDLCQNTLYVNFLFSMSVYIVLCVISS